MVNEAAEKTAMEVDAAEFAAKCLGRMRILGDIISPPDDIDWDAWADEQYELYYKDLRKPAS